MMRCRTRKEVEEGDYLVFSVLLNVVVVEQKDSRLGHLS